MKAIQLCSPLSMTKNSTKGSSKNISNATTNEDNIMEKTKTTKEKAQMHRDVNHIAIMDKINNSDMDETRKMVYRSLLEKTRESTNGRTTNEKIQDITESLATLSQIIVNREMESDESSKIINELSKTVSKMQNDNEEMKTR